MIGTNVKTVFALLLLAASSIPASAQQAARLALLTQKGPEGRDGARTHTRQEDVADDVRAGIPLTRNQEALQFRPQPTCLQARCTCHQEMVGGPSHRSNEREAGEDQGRECSIRRRHNFEPCGEAFRVDREPRFPER